MNMKLITDCINLVTYNNIDITLSDDFNMIEEFVSLYKNDKVIYSDTIDTTLVDIDTITVSLSTDKDLFDIYNNGVVSDTLKDTMILIPSSIVDINIYELNIFKYIYVDGIGLGKLKII
jgi:hypothetical protein